MTLQNNKPLNIDFYLDEYQVVNAKQHSKNSRFISITCTDNGQIIALDSVNMIAKIKYLKPDNTYVLNDCEIQSDNTVLVELTEQMLSADGIAKAEIIFVDEKQEILLPTMCFYVNIVKSSVPDDSIKSSSEYSTLLNIIFEVNQLHEEVTEAEKIRNANENTRKSNESSRASEESSRLLAENSRVTTETTRNTNENTRKSNESSRINAENFRVTTETARVDAENARKINEDKRGSAETARVNTETLRISAEATRVNTENTRIHNENVRKSDETDRINTESVRTSAENIRILNENNRETTETSRIDAESSRTATETARSTAETARASSESTRNTNENTRMSNETARTDAENVRTTNENTRKTNESVRVSTENMRVSSETSRNNAESTRVSNESNRANAETARATAESARVNAENTRNSNETVRKSNEVNRIEAENLRQTNTATTIQNANNAISRANAVAEIVENFDIIELQMKINNKADLVSGKIPASQLPAYVDDVLSYTSLSAFPVAGEDGTIYIDKSTNKTYRWSSSTYVVIGGDIALGETSSTAYRGDRGKIAYDHSQIVAGNPHGTTATNVGLGNVPNVTTNDQIPTYTQAGTLVNIVSGEKLSVSFGKIMKAIATFITHLADTVSHITSAERTVWNAKQSAITGGATTISFSNLTVSKALTSDSNGKVAVAATTSAELNYLTGVTSNVQTQLNAKSNTDTKNTAGSTDTTSKLFLLGAAEQSANPQTYSRDTAYVGANGHLYSNGKQTVNLGDSQALTNKTYNGYTLGAACSLGVDATVASGSTNLVTSGGVYTALANKAITTTYNIAINVSDWQYISNRFVCVKTVTGILSTDNPICDIKIGSGLSNNEIKTALNLWYCIDRITTSANTISFEIFEGSPNANINVIALVVR